MLLINDDYLVIKDPVELYKVIHLSEIQKVNISLDIVSTDISEKEHIENFISFIRNDFIEKGNNTDESN